jgi:hypothetical protein
VKCQHEGCDREGILCQLDDNEGDEGEYFCGEHAFEAGYCACCGRFWGGIESFEFGNGLCDNCRDSGDYGDFDEDEDYMDFDIDEEG